MEIWVRVPLVAARSSVSPYRGRRTVVKSDMTRERARFVITDQGLGFNPGTIEKSTDPSLLQHHQGRGLVLMKTFMDELRFNINGNQVIMEKYCQRN